MKKLCTTTSALALGVVIGAPASAQEWDLKWGGFYISHVGYVSVDSNTAAHVGADFDGVDVFTNAEIIFRPSVTLDNGLTFGIDVQMEALNSEGGTDGIDESFLSVYSDTLGRIDLGSENSAGFKMTVAAPQVRGGLDINSPSVSGFIPISTGAGGNLPFTFRDSGISSYAEVLGNNDVPRITYYTPSFNGLTLGVSYAATVNTPGAARASVQGNNNAANNLGVNRNIGVTDVFDIGLAYSGSFNGIDLDVAGRWGTAESNIVGTNDPEVWNVGFNVGFNGFVVGGGYGENDNGGIRNFDSEGWSFGVTYDIAGPWSVGFDTYQGKYEGIGAASGDEAEYEAYQLVASRSLGSGVTWAVYAIYAEGSVNADLGGTFGNANSEVDGTLIGTSISLRF